MDAKLSEREKYAVDDWMESGKNFHIIRDSPGHKRLVMGGLWGCRSNAIPMMASLISSWSDFNYGDDQLFLSSQIYPLIQHDVLIHSDFDRFEGENVTSFPAERKNYEWVGMPIFRPELLKKRQERFIRRLDRIQRSSPKKRTLLSRLLGRFASS